MCSPAGASANLTSLWGASHLLLPLPRFETRCEGGRFQKALSVLSAYTHTYTCAWTTYMWTYMAYMRVDTSIRPCTCMCACMHVRVVGLGGCVGNHIQNRPISVSKETCISVKVCTCRRCGWASHANHLQKRPILVSKEPYISAKRDPHQSHANHIRILSHTRGRVAFDLSEAQTLKPIPKPLNPYTLHRVSFDFSDA